MNNLPADNYTVESLVQFGLTEHEAKLLSDWAQAGKPGLSVTKAAQFGLMYALGFSCQEIAAQFPVFPIAILLYERVKSGWDKIRTEFEVKLVAKTPENALTAKLDATQMVSEIIGATNVKWRKELMKYLSDPDNEIAPNFLPDSIHQYKQMVEMMQSMTEPTKNQPPAIPTVNIHAGQGSTVRVVSAQDVKQALMAGPKPKTNE